MKEATKQPKDLLLATEDFFGNKLQHDSTLRKLKELPAESNFSAMMINCLEVLVAVLERLAVQ